MRNQTKLICVGAIVMVVLSSIIVMAVFEDVEGPIIYEVHILPVMPVAGDLISVVIYCIDLSGVSGAQLSISFNKAEWEVQDMVFYACLCIAGGRWVARFGPIRYGDAVDFFVTAFDNSPTRNPASTQMFTIELTD